MVHHLNSRGSIFFSSSPLITVTPYIGGGKPSIWTFNKLRSPSESSSLSSFHSYLLNLDAGNSCCYFLSSQNNGTSVAVSPPWSEFVKLLLSVSSSTGFSPVIDVSLCLTLEAFIARSFYPECSSLFFTNGPIWGLLIPMIPDIESKSHTDFNTNFGDFNVSFFFIVEATSNGILNSIWTSLLPMSKSIFVNSPDNAYIIIGHIWSSNPKSILSINLMSTYDNKVYLNWSMSISFHGMKPILTFILSYLE